MSTVTTVSTRKLFTGKEWFHNCSLVIEDGQIIEIAPLKGTPAHSILVPAFIDLQIYGAGGRLFSVYPELSSLELLYQECVKGGTHFFLPTVATNNPSVVSDCINAVKSYWDNGGKGCLGLHLEGPWLNPDKKGAHLAERMYSPTVHQVVALLQEGRGVIKMITLAPECCSKEVIQLLLENDIRISAGHSNASYEQANEGFEQGIQLATHLFNAMPAFQHRSPGLVGAILNHSSVMASIIPDGYHVDWTVIEVAQKIMKDRLFVITDAVTETDQGPYQHVLATDRYEANGVLSGSALTMLKACNNLINYAKLSKEEALRLCSFYPARAFGVDHRLGLLLPGYQAAYISLSENEMGFTLNSYL
jgi:N-acetylglucosamine-6-phosphate deacetylase